MITENSRFTIQQVAEATGLSVYTLRYYERIGLIHPIDRIENTHRRYSQDDIGWIEFLNKLRGTGMSIQEMQTYTELQRQGEETLPERVEMLRALRSRVEARIAELHEYLDHVSYKIDYYQGILSEEADKTPDTVR